MKNVRVTYRYPSWTHLQNVTEERGGDLRAVEGTDADLEVETDKPMRDGLLVLDDEQQIRLTGGEGNVYKGTVHMEKDGVYHVAALDQGQPVRLSNDFFIEARKAEPPNVIIARPGHDYRASPIEEVTVAVKADDEFGLSDMTLHYSVNGGPEQTVDLLKQKGAKQADGSTVLSLEDFKLVPGDVVSLYAMAKDAHAESRTDISFIQADPFEREFSQSQAAGGGGGGGGGGMGDQNDISQREKEIIAETWKQQGDKKATQQEAADAAKFLSGVQAKLGEQAQSLAGRMQSRELSQENEEFNSFVKDMNAAAAAMGPAAEQLQQQKWKDALPERTESAAEPAARRSHVPPDSSGVRQRGRRRRSGRRRRARPREPVRSGAGHRKESVRDGADRGRLGQPAAKRNRRSAAKARSAGAPPGRAGPAAAQQPAKLRAALAAGNAAPPGRRAAAPDGADGAQQRPERLVRLAIEFAAEETRRAIPPRVLRDNRVHPGNPDAGWKIGRPARAAGS